MSLAQRYLEKTILNEGREPNTINKFIQNIKTCLEKLENNKDKLVEAGDFLTNNKIEFKVDGDFKNNKPMITFTFHISADQEEMVNKEFNKIFKGVAFIDSVMAQAWITFK